MSCGRETSKGAAGGDLGAVGGRLKELWEGYLGTR